MTAQKNFLVDSFVDGLAIKAPVQTFTTAPITLSGEQTVNGVALVVNDRCLVKDQVDPIENGIYQVETSAWTRTADWDGNRDIVGGTLVPAYRISDGLIVQFQVVGAPDPKVPAVDAVTFTSYFDPAGIPVAVTLQQVTTVGNTTTDTIERTGAGVAFDARDGSTIRIREAADIDSFSMAYDGTNARFSITSGSFFFEASVVVENGLDTIQLTVDGVDANITVASVLDLNFTGASVGYKFDESIYITEKAAANADFGGLGQIWVRNDAPNTLFFTDDTGVDRELGVPTGGVSGTQIGVVFAGYVNAAASAEVVPSGWSVAVGGAGLYVITHNLGLNDVDDLSVVAMPEEAGQTQCSSDAQGTNTFDVTVISSDVGSNQDWWFIATLNVAQ